MKTETKTENKQKTKNKIINLNPNITIITLHLSGLNIPIKRHIGSVDYKVWPHYMLSISNSFHVQECQVAYMGKKQKGNTMFPWHQNQTDNPKKKAIE